jgi:endonuclease YncB( thermonuclease family)
VLAGLAACAAPAHAAETAACRVEAGTAATVASVVDERTFRLADGTEIRLAGLEDLAQAGEAGPAGAAASAARAELARLVLGKSVAIETLSEDRYGRRVALVALTGDSAAPPVQEQLLKGGNALATGGLGHAGCASRFLAAEREARTAGLGVWAVPLYLIRAADRPDALAGARGRFALVEGTVLSVNDRGATVYVNFGRRWSEDFTVTIAKRNVRNFTAAGLEPQRLAGRRVRIRGWVDERGGPWIEALRPEQIEFIDRR